jgi:PhoH-like ATPase
MDCFVAITVLVDDSRVIVKPLVDESGIGDSWGVRARNLEQAAALAVLLDPYFDLVTIVGDAGTGKTLVALAAGLRQVFDAQRYNEILVTRATVSVGEDIGFLPGTEEEKMNPWMGALEDNLQILLPSASEGGGQANWGKSSSYDFIKTRLGVRSMNYMRGRTFLDKFVIIDESQNLTPHQVKMLVTRAGTGSKIVFIGNMAQIDTPWLSETTSGLGWLRNRFASWQHSAHVTLSQVERSRLALHAVKVL